MKFKDRPDIPKPVLNALLSEEYTRSLLEHFGSLAQEFREDYEFEISVTTLPRPVRSRILSNRHRDEIVIDPISRYFAMRGHIVHGILEDHAEPGDLVEKRVGAIVRDIHYNGRMVNVYLHGQPDRYVPADKLVQDWKDVKANAIIKGEKFEFHAQLSINAHLLRENGYEVEHAQNVFLIKDFHGGKARAGNGYPREPVVVVDVPLWSTDKMLAYIRSRIEEHINGGLLEDDALPNCTPLERWQSMPEYKCYKLKEDGSRMANSKFTSNSKLESQEWIENSIEDESQKIKEANAAKKKPKEESELSFPKYALKEIPSAPVRCSYCDGRNWCSQWANDVAKGYVREPEPENEEKN